MSKIAILTLAFNNNYGGILQSYALQEFLKDRGHDVTLVNLTEERSPTTMLGHLKKIIKVIIGKQRMYDNYNLRVSQNMLRFVQDNMNLTIKIKDLKDFRMLNSFHFDAYIVGSDQVWRFEYTRDRYAIYFLDFVTNKTIKKISFAASFGIDNWTLNKEKTDLLSSLIKEFNSVSVREKSGVKLCEENLNTKAVHLLDPVFLIGKTQYLDLIPMDENKIEKSEEEGLLVYILDLDNDKEKTIQLIENELGLNHFFVGRKGDEIYPPISQWLNGFMKAKFILTDSFHGCAFAILFNKPFLVYGNGARGMARFESILDTFRLKSRLIQSSKEIQNLDVKEEINFDYINDIISKNRIQSSAFLEKSGL